MRPTKETRKAFKVAYLIGVSENVISRDFPEHYKATRQGNYFKNYKDVTVMRALNRARQNIIRYNHLYVDGKTIREITGKQMVSTYDLLESIGLDVEEVYRGYGQRNYVNVLTKMIDERIYGVLDILEIGDKSAIREYFYFPRFSSDYEFETYIKEQYTVPRPHGLVIYKADEVMNVIPYVFNNNYNLYSTAASMQRRKTITLGDMHKEDFKWRTKKLKESHTPAEIDRVLRELRLYEDTEEMVENEVPQEIKSIDGGVIGVYADTRSIDIYRLLSYLELVSKEGNIGEVVVYGSPDEVRELGKYMPHIASGVSHKLVEDSWSTKKDSKRVVSLVTEIVGREIEVDKVVIFSGSRLIEGMLRQRGDEEYVVCVEGEELDKKYKDYLDKEGIEQVDLEGIDGEQVKQTYKKISFKYELAESLMELPIGSWDILRVSEQITKRGVVGALGFSESDILDTVEALMEQVEVEVTNESKYVILEGERLEIK